MLFKRKDISEIANMQRQIDEYKRFVGDLLIKLCSDPNHSCMCHDIEGANLIYKQIEKLQKK